MSMLVIRRKDILQLSGGDSEIIASKYGNFGTVRGNVLDVNVNSPLEVVPSVNRPISLLRVQFTGGTYSGRRSGHS
ncbi:hypothetical protein CFAEC_09790 [Corynebacterium faecale]|nr:hypothetical protein CFAEC_09790 [Corynebacterium faecale]